MKKRMMILGSCILVMAGIFAGGILLFQSKTNQIQAGIKREIADEKCVENDNCYMVKFSGENTGLFYVISEGSDKGIEVELEGDTPLHSLSNVFRNSGNEFLIYGYEKNIENKTDNPSAVEDFINPYTIVVERWEIITPIYRDYTYSSHSRVFYPKRYIDRYDLEHEDYKAMEW